MYEPQQAYVYKSGKRKGKSPAQLTFTDPSFLIWHANKLNQSCKHQPNKLHLHYQWLIKQANKTKPVQICPQCGQKPIRFMSIRHSHSGMSFGATYCYCKDCVQDYQNSGLEIKAIKFGFLKDFQEKQSKQDFKNMIKVF